MNKIDERFIATINSNKRRSFFAAHRMLLSNRVSRNILLDSAKELINRSEYLYANYRQTEANNVLQFAFQIIGFISQTQNK